MKAFPISVMTYEPDHRESPRYTTTWHEGMDLRDYFAAKAMQGYMSRQLINGFDEDVISEMSYKVADAMMKAREQ